MSIATAGTTAEARPPLSQRLCFSILAGLLLALALLGGQIAEGQASLPPEPARYIVMFEEGVLPTAAAADLAARHGLAIAHVYSSALSGFSGTIPEGRLVALAKDPRVKLVEPDLEMQIFAQTLPTGVDRVEADKNPTADIDGVDKAVNATVAILDTGIDLDHPDLNVDVGLSQSFDSRQSVKSADDEHGHGTHVAGTVGARDNDSGVVGVAPGVKLVAIRVLGADGSGYLSDILKGIDYVTAKADQISVANMSLGGTGVSTAYRTAFQNSVAKGVIYTVAAGNAGKDIYGRDGNFGTRDDTIPAAYPEVATISAMADSDGKPGGLGKSTSYGADDSFASFSNYSRSVVAGNPVTSSGAGVDLLLPGVSIFSTYKGGSYATMSGTSMAAPHAAGLAALYVAVNGKPSTAGGVYAVRQALIDAGVGQDAPEGLTTRNDPDSNWERIGWAGLASVPQNRAPTADSQSVTTSEGTPLDITLTGSDPDEDALTYTVTQPASGTLSGTAPNLTYTPNPGFNGSDSFTFKVSDGEFSSDPATVSITVSPATQPGTAQMHVSAIDMALKKTGVNTSALATVTVVDSNVSAVGGVTVSGQWSGATSDADTGVTDAAGRVTFESNKLKNPPGGTTFTFTVTGAQLSGWTYDASVESKGSVSVQ